jgi:hypothetical protein
MQVYSLDVPASALRRGINYLTFSSPGDLELNSISIKSATAGASDAREQPVSLNNNGITAGGLPRSHFICECRKMLPFLSPMES